MENRPPEARGIFSLQFIFPEDIMETEHYGTEATGMALKPEFIRGCLLGMAVGDAMGYTVDSRSWKEIQEDYGPNGLLGYDLVNGYADVTSYTQLAAFTCNGLLLAMTRGQLKGVMAPLSKYVGLSSREWAASQRPWGRPEHTFCWLLRQPELCRRHCMDTRMLDTLARKNLGTLEEPQNSFSGPGSITCAVGAGLFCALRQMEQQELDLLGAEVVGLTHGTPLAFLSGAALAHIVSRSLTHPEIPLKNVILETSKSLKNQFGHQYSPCFEVSNLLHQAVSLSESPNTRPVDAMEFLRCENAAQVLSGALYACLTSGASFDSAMITAINHSGRSAAVGAVAGAILGLRMGERSLPGFYIECLEPAETLTELADDLYHGCPMEMGNKLFDLDWDRKYVHGGK